MVEAPACGARVGRREARRWVRNHWVEIIANSDLQHPEMADDLAEALAPVWHDECLRIARLITPKDKP